MVPGGREEDGIRAQRLQAVGAGEARGLFQCQSQVAHELLLGLSAPLWTRLQGFSSPSVKVPDCYLPHSPLFSLPRPSHGRGSSPRHSSSCPGAQALPVARLPLLIMMKKLTKDKIALTRKLKEYLK